MRKVKVFDLEYDKKFREDFAQGCNEIFDEAHLTNHTKVKQFEVNFATFNQSSYSLAVANGTSALEVTLRALNIKGKKVILPTNTFIATACAVLNAGGIPEFIDVENNYYALCPEELEKAIDQNTGAVIVVHIGGYISAAIETIVDICRQNNIPLVEDCAQAHGATFRGIPCGNFGIAGCFSHFMTKIMTTGEGGSIVTNDQKLYQKLFSIRQFGMDPNNPISHIRAGSNFKMTEFQALLGILELKRIKERIAQRRQLALRYQQNLADSNWKLLGDSANLKASYYKQIVIPPLPRAKVQEYFSKKNIALTGGVYYIPLHLQPSMQQYVTHKCPIAERFASTHICPPCYPEITLETIDRICEAMRDLK